LLVNVAARRKYKQPEIRREIATVSFDCIDDDDEDTEDSNDDGAGAGLLGIRCQQSF